MTIPITIPDYQGNTFNFNQTLAFSGRSFLCSFLANAVLFGRTASIAASGGALAAVAAVLSTVAKPIFQSLFEQQGQPNWAVDMVRVFTVFTLCSLTGNYVGVGFDVVSSMCYSIFSNIVGLNAYICAV